LRWTLSGQDWCWRRDSRRSSREALEQGEERVTFLRREAIEQFRSDLLGYLACPGAQLTSGGGEFHSVRAPVGGVGPPDGKPEAFKIINSPHHGRSVLAGQVHQAALAKGAVPIQVEQDSEVPSLDAERVKRSGEGPGAVALRLAQQRSDLGEAGAVSIVHRA